MQFHRFTSQGLGLGLGLVDGVGLGSAPGEGVGDDPVEPEDVPVPEVGEGAGAPGATGEEPGAGAGVVPGAGTAVPACCWSDSAGRPVVTSLTALTSC